MIKGTTKLIKQMNKSNILSIIYNENSTSRAELAKKTKISKSTVSLIVDELIQEGLVEETEVGNSTIRGGRKPIQLEFNPVAGYIVGLEIGRKSSLCILSDLGGNVHKEEKIKLSENSEEKIMDEIIEALHGFIDRSGQGCNIIGMGIGIPGITDIENGMVCHAPELHWEKLEIGKIFEDEFKMKIFIDNDVNMAVLGEKWFGAGSKYSDFVFISIGIGIGSGIVINKKIHRGSSFTAGEVGYLVLGREALKHDKYTYGQFGYFESVASNLALESTTNMGCDEAFVRAGGGDENCKAAVERILDYLGLGIANIISILNPEALIIGGSMSGKNKEFIEPIKERVSKLTPVTSIIKPSDLGEKSAIMGCIATVLTNTYGIELY
ncbi:MAG: hypothetical protein APF77_01345 [Clostridia bacterium BRH_c25]|nr:MAG: hypothetical protein APF77_01345 [Clostridia bacterium BRH_c25]